MVKKWGKYFAKGAKVGLMVAMLATTSCGNQMSDDDGVTYVAEDKFGINSDFEFEQDLKADIFNRHRFAPKDGTFKNLSHDEISMFGWHLYKHAQKYVTNELKEFNNAMQNENNAKFRQLAQEMANTNFFGSINNPTIDSAITIANTDCGELFANMIYPLESKTRTEFMTCYDYLANRDLDNTKEKLQQLGIEANDRTVETALYNLLTPISEKTGVSVKTLQRGVNLALCSAGMHGARDLAGYGEAINRDPVYVPAGTYKSIIDEWTQIDFDREVNMELQNIWYTEHARTVER